MVDQQLLQTFMSSFYGYGSWRAKYWFIGMEEGGGDSEEEIDRRVMTWQLRGSQPLEDMHTYHADIGVTRHSGPDAKIQRTWGKLVRVVLAAEGMESNRESVRKYQSAQLGSATGETLLIELLPLPSPSTGHWLFSSAGIPDLATRDRYRAVMTPRRSDAIRSRIDDGHPANVIFYGLDYRAHWESISRQQFAPVADQRFLVAEAPSTRFVIAPHPVARGATNADFEAIGRWIAARP